MWITPRLIMFFPSPLNKCQNSHEKQWFLSSCSVCQSWAHAQEHELTWSGVPAFVAQLILLQLFTWDPQARQFLHWRKFKAFQVLCSSAIARFLSAIPAMVLLLLKVCSCVWTHREEEESGFCLTEASSCSFRLMSFQWWWQPLTLSCLGKRGDSRAVYGW